MTLCANFELNSNTQNGIQIQLNSIEIQSIELKKKEIKIDV